jgi:hypothetical protein
MAEFVIRSSDGRYVAEKGFTSSAEKAQRFASRWIALMECKTRGAVLDHASIDVYNPVDAPPGGKGTQGPPEA